MELQTAQISEEPACSFCEDHESETTHELYAIRKPGSKPDGPGWEVRAIISKKPILPQGENFDRIGQGLYDVMLGVGRHEIIVESPKHKHDLDEFEPSEIENVLRVYLHRMNDLASLPQIKYGLLFKNHGQVSGAARDIVRHSRSQLIGLPIIPKRVKEELLGAQGYYERRDRCVYCDMIRQDTSDGTRLVFQNEAFVAICPFASRAPFEMWVFPKKHRADFGRLEVFEIAPLANILKECLSRLHLLLNDPPFNMVLHTAPFRHARKDHSWKTLEEDTHWYFHIQPRLTHSAGFEWGTGIHINPTPPEEAAMLLREVN